MRVQMRAEEMKEKKMERLTRRDIYGDTECIRCFTERCMLGCVNCEAYIDVIERLRAYEDTGLMPEQVEEIKTAAEKLSWISVEEKMPREYECVVVYRAESNIYDIAIYHNEHGFRPWYSGVFEDCPGEWDNPVTCWMRIPKPIQGK